MSVTILKNVDFMTLKVFYVIRYKILKDTDCGKTQIYLFEVISLKPVGCLMYSFLKLNHMH